jgi:rhomboid protease GluP
MSIKWDNRNTNSFLAVGSNNDDSDKKTPVMNANSDSNNNSSEGYILIPAFKLKSFTFIISCIIVGYYIIQWISYVLIFKLDWSCTLYKLGARHTPAIVNSYHIHRLFLPMIMHLNLAHILSNLFGILLIGFYIEGIFEVKKYISLFLVSGFFGNVLSALIYKDKISVGASTSVFGLYGFIFYYFYRFRNKMNWGAKALHVVFLAYFIWGWAEQFFIENTVDQAGHIGGLVSGFVLSYYLYETEDSWLVLYYYVTI